MGGWGGARAVPCSAELLPACELNRDRFGWRLAIINIYVLKTTTTTSRAKIPS